MLNFNQSEAADIFGFSRQAMSKLIRESGNPGSKNLDLVDACLSIADERDKALRKKLADNQKIKANLLRVKSVITQS